MDAIFKRISVRKYEDRPVEPEKVEKILRAAMAAPSARNQQPWEFYVVTSKEKIQELSRCSQYASFLKDAPLAIVPCCRKTGLASPLYGEIDLSIATEHILLEAVELGLGTCWMGIAPVRERMDAVNRVLGNPENLEAFALVACGYPAEERPQQDRYDESRIHWIR